MSWYAAHAKAVLQAFATEVQGDPLPTLLRPDQVYLASRDPLAPVLLVCLWFVVATAVLGAATQEFSWVDRIWSITPALYTWLFALHPMLALGEPLPSTPSRLVLMAGLTTLWGVRLTYNFARKGGYSGMEDYRWVEVRQWMAPWAFQLFNLGFIAFYQNVLLFLLTTPTYLAWGGRKQPLTAVDAGIALLFLALWVMETVADQQQWNFQTRKRAALSTRTTRGRRQSLPASSSSPSLLIGELADGFIQSGLFQFSRHPNFWAEQALWWVFYLFTYPAAGIHPLATPPSKWPFALNWTVVGAFLLSLLFQGSTDLTEKLSVRKYGHKYRRYQKNVSRLLPWFPRRHKD